MNAQKFWFKFVFDADRDNGQWPGQILGNGLCGQFVFPLSFSGWWCTMKMGSALARQRVVRVIKATYTTDPNDDMAWKALVADALALGNVMAQLSNGWSTGLAGFSLMCAWFFCALFSMFVNTEYYDALATSGAEDGFPRSMCIFMLIFSTCSPLLIAKDVAKTSSKCDELMDKLNDLGIKHHVRIDWLETRLQRLHRSQGLGFVIFGLVLDQRVLGTLAVALGGGLVTVITWVLAMSEAVVATNTAGGACGMDAATQQKVAAYARDLLRNDTCAFSMNVSFAGGL